MMFKILVVQHRGVVAVRHWLGSDLIMVMIMDHNDDDDDDYNHHDNDDNSKYNDDG